MKSKTLLQIANMKNQTFGVEIEMYHITRSTAAGVVAQYFGTPCEYAGGPYRTYVARDNKGREWKAMSDGSLFDDGYGTAELVTPILTYDDMTDLQEIVRRLRKAGARSDASHSCGVHIHIGLGQHTPKTLRNLVNIMASHESLLTSALQLDRGRLSRWCSPVNPRLVAEINKRKPATMEKLADCWYKSNSCDYDRNAHYNRSRYHMLNLHASFTKGTIEFRLFQFRDSVRGEDGRRHGGLHAGELKSYIQLCLALSQQALDLRSASPIEPQHENPKFAMRTWLIRLGFVGDEFATARNVLTRHLDGDCAFRFNNREELVANAKERDAKGRNNAVQAALDDPCFIGPMPLAWLNAQAYVAC